MRCRFICLCLLVASWLSAQVQIAALPSPGFEDRIRAAVNGIWLINTHEHLETEEERLAKPDIDFSHIFRSYPEYDLVSAGMDPFTKDIFLKPELSQSERWNLLEPFWQAMRTTAYGRVPLLIAQDLYGVSDINKDTYQTLTQKIKAAQKPGLYRKILRDRAKIELTIQDLGHRKFDPEFYVHVEKFDHFIDVKSGAYMQEVGRNYGVEVGTLDDFVAALHKAFQDGLEFGMVGVKSALAYSRILHYENVTKEQGENVFAKLLSKEAEGKTFTFEEVKPLQDYMMHRVLDLVQEHKLPMQIHTGLHAGNSNTITNSKPTHLINLFMEYPGVNFCIFHSSYPYGGELSTLAKNFPNVFIDMCWSHIISPSYSEQFLNEWLETVPANKIMAFGGDYGIVEGTYAHSVIARQVVAKVLIEKVRTGYMLGDEAISVANRILRDNALEVFKQQGRSRPADNIQALAGSGFIRELWDLHQTTKGFIRDWMVIGPFGLGAPWGSIGNPAGYDKAYPPEEEINFSKSYQGLAGEVKWQNYVAPESGYLDFRSVLSPTDATIGYAYAEVYSPQARTVKITLGSNDGAKLWVNEEQIFGQHVGRSANPDQNILEAKLKKGKNQILAKVENWGGNWGLYVRLLDPKNELKVQSF